MRIQHNATHSMNLQVEIALPRETKDGGAERGPEVIVLPTGGDGDPASLAHRWSFTLDEAEQLARTLQDAAERARDMI
jgi:hypothetical protein